MGVRLATQSAGEPAVQAAALDLACAGKGEPLKGNPCFLSLFFTLSMRVKSLLSWPPRGLLVLATHLKTEKMAKTQERFYLNRGPKNMHTTYYKGSGVSLAGDLGNVIYVPLPQKSKVRLVFGFSKMKSVPQVAG